MNRFFNRILNVPISYQKDILDIFYKFLDEEINKALKSKTYNAGVLEYTIPDLAEVSILNEIEYNIRGREIIYYAIQVDKGISWEKLMEYGKNCNNPRFLVYTKIRPQILFAYVKDKTTFVVQPSNCEPVPLATLCPAHYERSSQRTIAVRNSKGAVSWSDEAKKIWDSQFNFMSSGVCVHNYTNQQCILKNCVAGARLHFNGMVTGGLNSIWCIVEKVLGQKQFPLVKITCKDDDKKIVGILLENTVGEKLCQEFEKIGN